MVTDRIKAFERAAAAARRFATVADRSELLASRPGESDAEAKERLAGLPAQAATLFRALRILDRLAPFERVPEDGVWETFLVETADGKSWISVVNAVGQKDRVSTFGTSKGRGANFDHWCRCREESTIGDTPWDEARKERRVVDYGGELTAIDRGVNYVVDLVTSAGCETVFSCEGHPEGAYLGFNGQDQECLADEFRKLGWIVDAHRGNVIVRMPKVRNVAERDAEWRRLSLEFSPILADAAAPRR